MQERRGPISATDLKAELNRRMAEDPDYRRDVEAEEARRAKESRILRVAEQPIVADLAAIGIKTDSVWNLYKIPESRPKAIPVLLDHLTRPYPNKVLMGIGVALDDKSARGWWPELKALYLHTSNATVRDGLAAALSGVAAKVHYDDLLSFLADESLGETRIYFLRPVNRIGNRMSSGKGRRVIEELAADRPFEKEAKAILAGRSRNQ
jgi:hypothetical protein